MVFNKKSFMSIDIKKTHAQSKQWGQWGIEGAAESPVGSRGLCENQPYIQQPFLPAMQMPEGSVYPGSG